MYNLLVVKSGLANSNGNDIWDHFADYAVDVGGLGNMDATLAKFGGVNLVGTPFIQFVSEEDAIVFKLKFGV
jgi:hypothetical protein